MDKTEATLILDKLGDLATGQNNLNEAQNIMNGEIKTLIERGEQQEKRHNEQIVDIKEDIQKAYNGRTVLHQKTDDLEKKVNEIAPLKERVLSVEEKQKKQDDKINEMKPVVEKTKNLYDGFGKIAWKVVGVIFIGLIIENLPQIIEQLGKLAK